MNTPKNKQSQDKENECLECSTFSLELEVQASQETDWELKLPNLSKLTPTHNEFLDTTFLMFPSTTILEPIIQPLENSILSGVRSPAQARVTQEVSKDYLIQPHHSGERDKKYCSKPNPSSVLWNSLKALSDEDLELFLPPSIWQDTLSRLKQSRRRSLEQGIKEKEFLSFPTLTSGQTSTKMRPAGQVKCEKWFKDKGLIPSGYQLGTRAIAQIMGFPSNWFEGLSQKNSNKKIISSQPTPQEESGQDISQEEQLHQDKQRSLYLEFSILIPCLVKQPKQPELRGIIQKDLGDRFDVYIPHLDKSIAYLKLFVYPDFSKSVGQIEKNPRKNITPSTNNPRKSRRKKGQGNGTIYYRTVTKNGKQYQEAYYHYTENGKKRTKYIPKKLLDRVKQAESLKLPVSDILILLGGDKKNPRKSSSTSRDEVEQKFNDGCVEQVLETNDLNPRKSTPPSTRKRKQGDGAGYIECKPIKRSGKEYKQYWYHWEIWREGDRLTKKSRYIPKRLVKKVEYMEVEKVSVKEILKLLRFKK